MPTLLHPPLPSAQVAPALAPALRLGAQPRAGRSHRGRHASLPRHRARRARARSAALGAGFFLGGTPRDPRAARLGSAALRPLLAAPGHHLGAPAALAELPRLKSAVLLAAADTLRQRLPPRGYVDGRTFNLAVGDKLPIEPLRARLVESGLCVGVAGQRARASSRLRGSLFDVFPMGARHPLRIDLFDDEIEAIREFDPDTQRSRRFARTGAPAARRARCRSTRMRVKAFRRRFRTRFEGDPTQSVHLSRRERRARAAGHRVLPAAVLRRDRHAARLSADGHGDRARRGACRRAVERAAHGIAERYEERRHDIERPVLAPDELFLPPEELEARLDTFTRVDLESFKVENEIADGAGVTTSRPPRRRNGASTCAREQPLAPLANFLSTVSAAACCSPRIPPDGAKCCSRCCARTALKPTAVAGLARIRRRRRAARAHDRARDGRASTSSRRRSPCSAKRSCSAQRARQERRRQRAAVGSAGHPARPAGPRAGLARRARGIRRRPLRRPAGRCKSPGRTASSSCSNTRTATACTCRCSQLHLVSRYTGAAPESAPLHKLGTDQWAKARKRAAEQDPRRRRGAARSVRAAPGAEAARRCRIARARIPGLRQRFPVRGNRRSGRGHPPGAARISTSERPMDRIVCGDVGFGKTEVAMRAAFVAAQAGKQVAVLVPTTLLAQQHTDNFRDRFADWPVRIEALSRFGTRQGNAARRSKASSAARSTSSSPRIGCCTRTCGSRISGSSSSMRSTASACATRSGCKRCAPKCTCSRSPRRRFRAR